jgi:hypothetical protein
MLRDRLAAAMQAWEKFSTIGMTCLTPYRPFGRDPEDCANAKSPAICRRSPPQIQLNIERTKGEQHGLRKAILPLEES